MKQEDKELLISDLCARLPYGVKCKLYSYPPLDLVKVSYSSMVGIGVVTLWDNRGVLIRECYTEVKPYLFPLSSMTEEQYKEFNKLTDSVRIDGVRMHHEYYHTPTIVSKSITDFHGVSEKVETNLKDYLICINWLNAHHFDYCGLIDKNLAIDCTNLNIYETRR